MKPVYSSIHSENDCRANLGFEAKHAVTFWRNLLAEDSMSSSRSGEGEILPGTPIPKLRNSEFFVVS